MIRKPTVLILGAGASVPYGFPTGPGLVNRILEICRQEPNTSELSTMYQAGALPADVKAFADALADMQFPSIDTFLEHRRRFADVGRLAIAAALIPCEREALLKPAATKQGKGEHWYRQLFENLVDHEGFSGRRLTVLTLNYDRSLEQYLFQTLKRDFELSTADAARKVREITFVHLHGQLGILPWWQPEGNDYPHHYSPDLTAEKLKAAAMSIRILSDGGWADQHDFTMFLNERILEARVIGFLGFGYHEVVLQRLKIAELRRIQKGFVADVFGSAFGLPNGRRPALTNALPGITLGHPQHTTYEFLNDCGLLFQ